MMDRLGKIDEAEKKVLGDGKSLIRQLRSLVEADPESLVDAIEALAEVREVAYEDLNQIQHEYLILQGAKWLIQEGHSPSDSEWHWNPRQTGGKDEPDLVGESNGNTTVSAEATTSKRPVGTIAERMKSTLAKLNNFQGKRFYFVRTAVMEKRAKNYVDAEKYDISVVRLAIDL